jgi:aldehyde dehydrogenase (NAD+)
MFETMRRGGWTNIVPEPYPEDPDSLEDVQGIVSSMRGFQKLGLTRDPFFRMRMLRRLRTYLKQHEDEALDALQADLGKAPFEGYATELGQVYDEIHTLFTRLAYWSQPRLRHTPISLFPGYSVLYPEPLGVVLVMSPWNYPLQLALIPLVDAVGAGNCVALKPSRKSPHTTAFIAKLCREVFDPHHVYCFPGSDEMNGWLLETPFDKLFFTGSKRVGRKVMAAAAEQLCDVTLELGGKNPCIVDRAADLERAAQRIAWGKCLNAGQTCVAPDYLLVHEGVVIDFLAYLEYHLHRLYGKDILASPDYPRIVDRAHFDRLCRLIDEPGPTAQVIFGGGRDADALKIEPTVLFDVTLDDPVMQDEVFGPVLPILTFRTLAEAIEVAGGFDKPLACYVFSQDPTVQRRVVQELDFGGGCINDTIVHVANNELPFGGIGPSGLGAYHGKAGFECFTHYKPVIKRSTFIEVPLRRAPYAGKLPLLRLLLR